MPVTAKLNHLRVAPRKVRLIADLIREKRVEDARNILNFATNKSAAILHKLLKSAIASAKNNLGLEESNLVISKITVDEGPKLKRWRARARGSAFEIQKKTSHVTLILSEISHKGKAAKKIKKEMEKKEEVEKRIKAEDLVSESKEEKITKSEKPKVKPQLEINKPKTERGIRRIFRRKAF